MKRWIVPLLVAGSLAVSAALGVVAGAASQGRPLSEAVAELNQRAQEDETGRTQPPLTGDEVAAAIYGWTRDRSAYPDRVFALYRKIADTRRLPKGAQLEFTTRWSFQGRDFDVWWVDLRVAAADGGVYKLRLRDQKLRSRPSAPLPPRDPGLRPVDKGILASFE